MNGDDRVQAGVALWREICIVDRVVGMMFNLPLGTSMHLFAKDGDLTSPDDKIVRQAYLCRLADLAAQVQGLDEMHAARRPDSELFERALKIDQQLNSLATQIPDTWLATSTPDFASASRILQYWHHYFTVRAHLHLAMKDDESGRFAYSTMACTQASRELIQSYTSLRLLLPIGFFASRILDLQVLTAAVFLVNTCHRPSSPSQALLQQSSNNTPTAESLIEQLLQVMDAVSRQPGGDYARESAVAIRSLSELLSNPDERTGLTFRIPLLGKLQVSRRHSNRLIPTHSTNTNNGTAAQTEILPLTTASCPKNAWQPQAGAPFASAGLDPMGTLSWSMDFGGDFPFLSEDAAGVGGMDVDSMLSFTEFGMQI